MYKNQVKIIVLFLLVLIVPVQPIAGKDNNFKFPQHISYKIIQNKRCIATTVFKYKKKGGGTNSQLTMDSIQGFGIQSNNKIVAHIREVDLSLFSSFVMKGKAIVEELRFKEEENLGLLGNQVYIHKSSKANSPTITEIASPYTVIDLLSSFVVLSNKIANKNYTNERYNLFVVTSYIVDCIVENNVMRQYKDKRVSTSKVSLKSIVGKSDQLNKTKQPKSVDLVVFYIYNDISKGFWYPICVEIEDDKGNKFQLIADKLM